MSGEADAASDPEVILLSGDLMFSSKVKSTAQRNGLAFRLSGSLPEDAGPQTRYVVVDLSTRSGVLDQLPEQCQQRCPQAVLVAYGPHVQVDKLKAARQAGIPNVLTNGQFDMQMGQLLR